MLLITLYFIGTGSTNMQLNMQLDELKKTIIDALEELKVQNLKVLDVREISGFTDLMVIGSGNSSRHVKALADKVVEKCKQAGVRPLGVEGEREAQWILIDLGDAVVHVMNPETREFYNLEKLWSVHETRADRSAVVH